jgi:hypothetical protein
MTGASISNEKKAINTILFSIVGNGFLAIIKGLAELFGNYYA